jgi:hypothetical protein
MEKLGVGWELQPLHITSSTNNMWCKPCCSQFIVTFWVRLFVEILLKMKWTLSWMDSDGWANSDFSVAPRRVSILLACAIEG